MWSASGVLVRVRAARSVDSPWGITVAGDWTFSRGYQRQHA